MQFIVEDFNTRPKSCWPNDIRSMEGNHLDSLGSTDGLRQSVLEPRHILPDLPSCNMHHDLSFTNEPDLTPADSVVSHPYIKLSSSNSLC